MSKPSPLYPNHYYHIYNRGNNRENLFRTDENYRYFLKLYTKHIEPIANTFAYCLLPNHFHILVRIKSVDEQNSTQLESNKPKKPSQHFSNFFNAYTKSFNKAFNRTGALFQRPFGRIPVTSDAYFTQLIIYIHQNPQKHNLIDDFQKWPYSSYRTLLLDKPSRLKRDYVLSRFQNSQGLITAHQRILNEAEISPLIPEDFD